MPYPSVNLEPKPEGAAPSPIVAFHALRPAFTHEPVKCVACRVECETFADAEHEDGSVTGWVPVCETCAAAKKPAVEAEPEPSAAPSPAPQPIPAPTPVPSPAPAE